jgi:hypothetical protein
MRRNIVAEERLAIIAIRKANPSISAWALAKHIKLHKFAVRSMIAQPSCRPLLSIYAVIRRFDAKGYYADGGEAKAALWRRTIRNIGRNEVIVIE